MLCIQDICALGDMKFLGCLYLFWSLDHYNTFPMLFKSIMVFALRVVKILMRFIPFFCQSPGKHGLREGYKPVNIHYVYAQLIWT